MARKSKYVPPIVDIPQPESGYVINLWSGKLHYECRFCAFDGLNEREMLTHLVEQHDHEPALVALIAQETT